LSLTQAQYASAKEIAEQIQRLPLEAQQAILNMLHGAVAISDMYRGIGPRSQSETRPGA